ncbi:MAG: hypothetical protein RR486_06890 [Clostridium sp.]|uniref:hypothetical protein n=1 Tax=Clostridium sp. TaxID=1506 RepID=UPI003046C6B7
MKSDIMKFIGYLICLLTVAFINIINITDSMPIYRIGFILFSISFFIAGILQLEKKILLKVYLG